MTQVPEETITTLRDGNLPSDPKQAALVRFAKAAAGPAVRSSALESKWQIAVSFPFRIRPYEHPAQSGASGVSSRRAVAISSPQFRQIP